MAELHEAEFFWPHTDALNVIVTGTFDNWSSTVKLARSEGGFKGTAQVPWGERTLYKFVVDGRWTTHDDHPTETDPAGNVNNVYMAPPKPTLSSTTNGVVAESVTEKVQPNGIASEVVADDAPIKVDVKPSANGTNGFLDASGPKTPDSDDSDRRSFVADIADTIAAREGASTPIGYVVSGIGAAIGSVVGVDPINGAHIALPTPKEATFPDVPAPVDEEIVKPKEPLDIAPDVPVEIVPVNAPENNTVPTPEATTKVPDVPAETPVEIPVTDTAAIVVPVSEPAVAVPEPTPAPEAPPAPVAVATEVLPVEPSTHSPIGASAAPAAAPVNGDASPAVEEVKPAEADTAKDLPAPPLVVETPASPVPAPVSKDIQPSSEQAMAPKAEDAKPAEEAKLVVDTQPTEEAKPVEAEKPAEIAKAVAEPPKTPPKDAPKGLAPPSPTTPPASAPSTPAKSSHHRFPSFSSPRKSQGSASVESSPNASNTGTMSSMRKKRTSIFGKISHIFKHDKEKEGKEAKE
ncbi:hypothetical protein HGRIS_009207 [Hohenbuehelia grisea]|uniref:AMP-activated protein kinase glycogen-binding domain-containing protein n=1 Tax=Hohenbuehelia grisea TaxID=104357 RepID=A0ABR3J0T8_9AGAR